MTLTAPLPRPLELVRLADAEVDELLELLEQLAPAARRPGSHAWELGTGERLELVAQLTVTATRQARVTADSGGVAPRPADDDDVDLGAELTARTTALPYVGVASDVAGQLRAHLAGWAARTLRQDLDEAPIGPRLPAPRTLEPADVAAWLLTREHALTWRVGSTREELAQLRRLVRKARGIVDRPADRWYAGPCATPLRDDADNLVIVDGAQAYCDADLYARPDVPVVVCRACGATHRVESRRAELLRLSRDYVETATVISRALTSLGTPVTPALIRKWKQRGRLVPHGVNAKGDPLYLVGDVMDRVTEAATRPARKTRAA